MKDCCDIVLWLLGRDGVSGLFNVGTGQARSFADLMGAVGAACGTPVEIAFVDMPEAIRGQYQSFTEASMGKLRAAGYSAAPTRLEEAVADYVTHYLSRPDPCR